MELIYSVYHANVITGEITWMQTFNFRKDAEDFIRELKGTFEIKEFYKR